MERISRICSSARFSLNEREREREISLGSITDPLLSSITGISATLNDERRPRSIVIIIIIVVVVVVVVAVETTKRKRGGSEGEEKKGGGGNPYPLTRRRLPSLPSSVVAATASRRGIVARSPVDFQLVASRSACYRSAPVTPCCYCCYCCCYSADRYLRKSLLPLI